MPALAHLSEHYLASIDRRLADVVRAAQARTPLPIIATEGRRSERAHRALWELGGTRSVWSPHCDGRGVRLSVAVPDPPRRRVRPRAEHALMLQVAAAMGSASRDLGVPVTWCWTWQRVDELPEVISPRLAPASDWPDAQGFVLAAPRT